MVKKKLLSTFFVKIVCLKMVKSDIVTVILIGGIIAFLLFKTSLLGGKFFLSDGKIFRDILGKTQ